MYTGCVREIFLAALQSMKSVCSDGTTTTRTWRFNMWLYWDSTWLKHLLKMRKCQEKWIWQILDVARLQPEICHNADRYLTLLGFFFFLRGGCQMCLGQDLEKKIKNLRHAQLTLNSPALLLMRVRLRFLFYFPRQFIHSCQVEWDSNWVFSTRRPKYTVIQESEKIKRS